VGTNALSSMMNDKGSRTPNIRQSRDMLSVLDLAQTPVTGMMLLLQSLAAVMYCWCHEMKWMTNHRTGDDVRQSYGQFWDKVKAQWEAEDEQTRQQAMRRNIFAVVDASLMCVSCYVSI
jgi:hypothetical protein